MKKIIAFLVLYCFIHIAVFGTITGSGTYLDPYTGILNTTMTWSGKTYIDIVRVGIGGSLTISAGAQIYGSNMSSSLIISGNGILTAVGTPASIITFSADNDGDGSPSSGPYPSETWVNILFDFLCTGNSTISYATIENGTGDAYFTGGGIDIKGNNVTISHSTIRYCNNGWGNGGGIAVTPSGSNVTLSNLIIHDNIASGNGGGIFTEGNVIIYGCEIYGNTATSGAGICMNAAGSISQSVIHDNSGGEGIYSFGTDGNGVVSNCIIYNNSVGIYFFGGRHVVNSTIINNGTGIYSATGFAPKIVNSVLWGNTTQYGLESGALIEMANCGIQGGFTIGTNGGGNKNLSATNGDNTGPNFVNSSTDFHINAGISPLVDGGSTSYGGVPIPGTDIEGHSRISTLDIGAHEFFYYMWNGAASTTTWATPGNWVGSPTSIPTTISDSKVLIPKGCSFYPLTSTLLLTNRSILTIEPEAGLTVTGVTNVASGCTFTLKSDSSGSANFKTGSSVIGSFNIELFLAGGGDPNYKWHYVIPPVASISKSVLTTDIGNAYNLLNYIESKVTTDKSVGWNWHDSSTPIVTLVNTFGYNVYVTTDKTALFTGLIRSAANVGHTNITFTSTDPAQSGWNLIGNPYTCGVNANSFLFGESLDIDKTVYVTRDNVPGSWSVGGGAGINGVTNIIPPMQGFFVHASYNGPARTLGIPASSRVYTTRPLYKKGLQVTKGSTEDTRTNPFLKFNISDGASITDESIIYFFSDATSGFDGDYDAYKMLAANPAYPQIYSISGGTNFGINGLPIPEGITTVPVYARIGVAKNYTINVLDLQILNDYDVTLIHGINRINLKTNPNYTFSAGVGTITDMSIEFKSLLTNVSLSPEDQTSCWYSHGVLFVKQEVAAFGENSTLYIYDLNGRVVFTKENINTEVGETVSIPINLPNGFYVANFSNRNIKVVKKIVISN